MTERSAKPRKPRHGTVRRYKDGCRCDPCRGANTRARQREREAAAKRDGKPVPTRSKRVPTPRPVPTTAEVDRALDGLELLLAAGPIEQAAREALTDPKDASTRLRHELVFRGARSLDDPKNARYFASTVEAVRKVLADLTGGDADDTDIVDAIRRAGRGGDGPEVGDSA